MALVRKQPAAPAPAPAAGDPRAALDGATAAERREAAHLLASDPDAVDSLADRLGREADKSVREAILLALGRIGTEAAAERLFDLLGSEDVWLRNAAIETLSEMDAAVIGALDRALSDLDSDRRIFAVNILVSLRHRAAVDYARRVLAEDDHVNVVAAAIDVLAEIGTPDMIPEIEAAAARFPDAPFLTYAARAASRRIA
ncbi:MULTISPECIES: HEAT repeat domain-containing protein [unclassified Methylobacterium]|uniref:HEAT repeat domain-containing protein n=1 Tax=unclassified Methylobacterium TaxID=2615210 RepID=UPI001FBB7518|nr:MULTISPECIES: HEAT repeat domain-containing protein [unclassified Methylobacterium]MCJ2017353.1 HEAT repeat domain-containing protein [Methylobacterium sp. E-065]